MAKQFICHEFNFDSARDLQPLFAFQTFRRSIRRLIAQEVEGGEIIQ